MGGGIYWIGNNGALTDSIFTGNVAKQNGGAICWLSANCTITDSTFIDNTANNLGGAIYWDKAGAMIDCCFVTNEWVKSNGIYAGNNLNIIGGSGIVDIVPHSKTSISGISIVVLNNETYYYPPNTNINLTNKKGKTQSNETYRIFNRTLNYYS